VALTRGKEQVQVFTDDKNDLLRAMSREDDPLSATNLAEQNEQHDKLWNPLARQPAGLAMQNQAVRRSDGLVPSGPELTHER
jgi:hypothetical protein